jgi:AcrR family transcriptional regulator
MGMKGSPRKTFEERRQSIIEAIKYVFAEKGFEKTTTRELAKTAGVSEALLYKHFPSKESMYAAIHNDFINNNDSGEIERIMALNPSTSTLVIMVHSMVNHLSQEQSKKESDISSMHLLMTRSLLEDGDYARLAFKQFAGSWLVKFEECVKEAAKAGDLREIPVNIELRGWLAHSIAVSIMMHLYPKVPVMDFKVSREKLVEQAVWFVLLGTGMKADSIKRNYNPSTLALLYE